jgi:hypothetical protein
MLPNDKQVNEEAAKALVKIVPEVKEAALQNKRLDRQWLSESLATNLEAQDGTMAMIAPRVRDLIQLDPAELLQARNHLLANWSHISQEITATRSSEVSDIEQGIRDIGGQISQTVTADDHSVIRDVKQNACDTSALQRTDDSDHGKIR